MSGLSLLLLLALLGLSALGAVFALERRRRRTHPVSPGLHPEIALPHEQDFELYHNALSLCSMKVRFCLAELGLVAKSHPIDLIETGAYENIRPAFLRVNPAGTVPVLVHRGHPVYESHEQIRYAAAQAPAGSPDLVPADPALRAEMEAWIERSSLVGDPMKEGARSAGNAVPGLTVPLFAAMIDAIPVWRILEGLLFHIDRRRPVVFLVLKADGLRRLHRLRPAMAVLARSRRHMHAHLDALEERLRGGGGPWILGGAFSLADVSWLAIFERLVQADLEALFLDPTRRPACARYWARLQQRPAFAKAVRDHEHPTVVRGTRRIREAKAALPALRLALEGPASEPAVPS